jgi:hypothetical protein
MKIAEYRAMAYANITPQSELKTDDNGYYYCIVGAFDVKSRNGAFYPCTDAVRNVFAASGAFMRRVKEGNCRGELDHPNLFGMSLPQILNRLPLIDGTRVCVHYKHFELVESKDEFGKPIILVYAWLRPDEPYGHVLEARLKNRDSNCAFSVRSYTRDSVQNGMEYKEIVAIVTYDAVDGPGLKVTSKLETLDISSGLESVLDKRIIFTEEQMSSAIGLAKHKSDLGLESEHTSLVQVRDSLGWNQVQVVNSAFLGWHNKL